jgi:hypothetical protein
VSVIDQTQYYTARIGDMGEIATHPVAMVKKLDRRALDDGLGKWEIALRRRLQPAKESSEDKMPIRTRSPARPGSQFGCQKTPIFT